MDTSPRNRPVGRLEADSGLRVRPPRRARPLGDGGLFDTRHEGRHYTWRIIHSGEGDVAAFFVDLEAAVGDRARMEMLRTTDTVTPTGDSSGEARGPSPEQEAALRATVERGYYESPRDVDVGELADHLDVPRSTLTYRLRRAEEQLAKQYVAGGRPTAGLSTRLWRPLRRSEYSNQGLSS